MATISLGNKIEVGPIGIQAAKMPVAHQVGSRSGIKDSDTNKTRC